MTRIGAPPRLETEPFERPRFRRSDLAARAAMMAEAQATSIEQSGWRAAAGISGGVTIHRDRDLLERMIAKRAENAMRQTPAGAALAMRLLSRAEDERGPSLAPEDDGSAVPATERRRVRHACHRFDQSRADAGRGGGRALVAAVAALPEAALTRDQAPRDGRGAAVSTRLRSDRSA